MARRDKNLTHVIISEKKDTKIAAFQVGSFSDFTLFDYKYRSLRVTTMKNHVKQKNFIIIRYIKAEFDDLI